MNFNKVYKYSYGHAVSIIVSTCIGPVITWFFEKKEVALYYTSLSAINLGSILFSIGLDQFFLQSSSIINYHDRYFIKSKNIILSSVIIISFIALILFNKILFDSIQNTLIYVILTIVVYTSSIQRLVFAEYKINKYGSAISAQMTLQKILLIISILSIIYLKPFPEISLVIALGISYMPILVINEFHLSKKRSRWNNASITINTSITKEVKSGAILVVGSILFTSINLIDRWLIQSYVGNDALAVYSIGASIANIAFIIGSIFLSMWLPSIYTDKTHISKNINKLIDRIFILILPTIAGIEIIKIFSLKILPNNYQELQLILPALIIIPMIYTISEIFNAAIIMSKKIYYTTIISGSTLLFSVIIDQYLVKHFGLLGSIHGQLISILTFALTKILIARFLDQSINILKPIIILSLLLLISQMHMNGYN